MTEEPLLSLAGVHTHIGQYHILQGIDLEVPRGGMTVLLGRNGAGKTTTLKTIMGLLAPSQGEVRFRGQPIGGRRPHANARDGIAYVPEDMGIFAGLTVKENMTLAAREGAFSADRLDWLLNLFPALRKFWEAPAGVLSGGQKQMLSIARAMIEPRELLLIDEPTKGLAPAIITAMIDAFRELKRSETTVLLVEQNFLFASSLGDTVAVVDDGRTVHRGTMAELTADAGLQERLLGLSLEGHG